MRPRFSCVRPRRSAAPPRRRTCTRSCSRERSAPAGHAFPRTPAFAWDNVKGASSLRVPALDEQELLARTRSSGRRTTCRTRSRPFRSRSPGSPATRTRSTHAFAPSSAATRPLEHALRLQHEVAAPRRRASRPAPTRRPASCAGRLWTARPPTRSRSSTISPTAQRRRSRPRRPRPTCASTTRFTNDLGAQGGTQRVLARSRRCASSTGKPLNQPSGRLVRPLERVPRHCRAADDRRHDDHDLSSRSRAAGRRTSEHARRPAPTRTSSSPASGGAAATRSTASAHCPRSASRPRRHLPALPRLRLHGRGLREPRPRLRPGRKPRLRAAAERRARPRRTSPHRPGPRARTVFLGDADTRAHLRRGRREGLRRRNPGRPSCRPDAPTSARRPEGRPQARASGTTTGPRAATTGPPSRPSRVITPEALGRVPRRRVRRGHVPGRPSSTSARRAHPRSSGRAASRTSRA